MTYQSSNNLGSSPLSVAQGNRVRSTSMELNSMQYMDAGFVRSNLQQDPFSLLLQQDATAAATITSTAANGFLQPTIIPDSESLGMSSISGQESLPLDAEEPGPLPCLPRSSRLGAPFSNHSSLMLQQQQQLQQLQRGGYQPSGTPGLRQQVRPRRHSVTIGMLNESQQSLLNAAALAGQLPGSSAQLCSNGPSQWSLLQQQLAAQQSPQAQQMPPLGLPAGLHQCSTQLGLGSIGLGDAYAGTALQQLNGQAPVALTGSSGVGSSSSLAGLDMMPAHALHAPRMPGGGNSRRHSWAPMGAESSMAYAHQCLLLQRASNLSAQLGDAGALFLSQQQHDQLGVGGVGGVTPMLNGFSTPGVAGIQTPVLGGFPNGALLSGDSDLGSGSNALVQPVLPLYTDVCKEQLAQQLQQQLQQLQLQQQGARVRLPGPTRALDPFAEPFVSQAATLLPSALGNLSGISSIDPLSAALQRQQQTALTALQFEDAGLSAAAASMYTPLQVDGIAVDTQLLVSPYVDSWDLLNQGSLAVPAGPVPLTMNGNAIPPLVNSVPAPLALPSIGNNIANSKPKGMAGRSIGISNGSTAQSLSSPVPVSNGKSSSNSQLSSTATAAAVAAAASMVASLPPLSKVCSDVPWDLRKAADEDAKLLAQQQSQLQKLAQVMEQSKTLQKVHAASAKTQNGKKAGAEHAQVSFSYQLPDTGDDTWGGSSVSPSVPGGSCISQEPSNKLFVGNIGWWVTEEDLLHWFSRFGTVINVKIMYNSRKMHKPKDKWRSREYGFIDYACPEEAAKAIVWMDGVELPELVKDTCGIIVQYAKPTSSSESAAGGEA